MKLVPINKREQVVAQALVDDEDYELVVQFRWTLHVDGYACRVKYLETRAEARAAGRRNRLREDVMMHRFLLGLAKGDTRQGDHEDRNRLNNQRSNLRITTIAGNTQNKSLYTGTSSSHQGVAWYKRAGKWRAYGSVGGKQYHLGYFADEDQAGAVARQWRRDHQPWFVPHSALSDG